MYSSSSPAITITSVILCFNKHRLTQVHLEMAVKMEREIQLQSVLSRSVQYNTHRALALVLSDVEFLATLVAELSTEQVDKTLDSDCDTAIPCKHRPMKATVKH